MLVIRSVAVLLRALGFSRAQNKIKVRETLVNVAALLWAGGLIWLQAGARVLGDVYKISVRDC